MHPLCLQASAITAEHDAIAAALGIGSGEALRDRLMKSIKSHFKQVRLSATPSRVAALPSVAIPIVAC